MSYATATFWKAYVALGLLGNLLWLCFTIGSSMLTRTVTTHSGWHARLRERYARRRVKRSRVADFETPRISYRLSFSNTWFKIAVALELSGSGSQAGECIEVDGRVDQEDDDEEEDSPSATHVKNFCCSRSGSSFSSTGWKYALARILRWFLNMNTRIYVRTNLSRAQTRT